MGILSSLADTTAGRQFGNVVDELQSGDVVGAADDFAGQTDESIGRQFDDTPGGGFADTDTYFRIATGTNTDETAGDVLSETTGSVGDAVGASERDPLGGLGDAFRWVGNNPKLVIGAILFLYLVPLLTNLTDVVAGVAGDG